MTYDFEAEARRRLNEAAGDSGLIRTLYSYATRKTHHPVEAMCRLLEEYQAFRREVSDMLEGQFIGGIPDKVRPFIIPKPVDPLVEVMNEMGFGMSKTASEDLRKALAKRGYEITKTKEKNNV